MRAVGAFPAAAGRADLAIVDHEAGGTPRLVECRRGFLGEVRALVAQGAVGAVGVVGDLDDAREGELRRLRGECSRSRVPFVAFRSTAALKGAFGIPRRCDHEDIAAEASRLLGLAGVVKPLSCGVAALAALAALATPEDPL